MPRRRKARPLSARQISSLRSRANHAIMSADFFGRCGHGHAETIADGAAAARLVSGARAHAAMARRPRAVPRVALGDHAAADARRGRARVLRALSRGRAGCVRARGTAGGAAAQALGGAGVLQPRAQGAGMRPRDRGARRCLARHGRGPAGAAGHRAVHGRGDRLDLLRAPDRRRGRQRAARVRAHARRRDAHRQRRAQDGAHRGAERVLPRRALRRFHAGAHGARRDRLRPEPRAAVRGLPDRGAVSRARTRHGLRPAGQGAKARQARRGAHRILPALRRPACRPAAAGQRTACRALAAAEHAGAARRAAGGRICQRTGAR